MALTPRLEVRQAQSLTLTPQLMQSIKLLQLSHLELNAFVEAELERNPLLERTDAEPGPPESDAPGETLEGSDDAGKSQDTLDQVQTIESADKIAGDVDAEVSDMFPEQSGSDAAGSSMSASTGPGSRSGSGDQAPDLEAYVAQQVHLGDHLWDQAATMFRSDETRLIARYLIDSLDDNGYLATTVEEVAEQLGADAATVESVLIQLQQCEPAGVFARSVRECLALQLADKDRLDPMMSALLDHLDLVARHDMSALMRAIGADAEDMADMLAELRRLDPRPGRSFDPAPVRTVVPDVFVRPSPAGGWSIEVNSETLPRVLVNRTYYASVARHARTSEDKEFLVDCLQSANWLTKSLDQRAQTILKVATEIVKQQDSFFAHGIAHLRPMTLKMVAEAISMHESTVSRVTANKYMATPRGLLDMKYFFTTALASNAGGSDHSAEAVRHKIRQLIDAEKAKNVLSDDAIAEILKREDGIDIARRTVAKYREGMNIASSVIRRREKKSQLQFV